MLETQRLTLRQWRDSDIAALVELNLDPQVMEFFPSTCTEAETRGMAGQWQQAIDTRGWGFWACELTETSEFIGMVGLNIVPFPLPGSAPGEDRVEAGWRLAKRFWGRGYAPEAAAGAIEYAFQQIKVPSVCAFTPVMNQRSQRVMEKLHMSDTGNNFRHPGVPRDSHLSEHVLYEITRLEFLKSRDWI